MERKGQRSSHDPVTQPHDHAGLFGDQNEIGRRHDAALRVIPADQRLGLARLCGRPVDDGLIRRGELPLRDCLVHVANQAHAFFGPLLHRRRETAEAAAPQVLGVELRHDDREFAAAQTRHRIGLAQAGRKALRRQLQQQVAAMVAERAVDFPEAIKVDEQDRQRLTGAARLAYPVGGPVEQHQAVGQLRQRIVIGLAPDDVLGLLLADVAHDAEHRRRALEDETQGDRFDPDDLDTALAEELRLVLPHRFDDTAGALDEAFGPQFEKSGCTIWSKRRPVNSSNA